MKLLLHIFLLFFSTGVYAQTARVDSLLRIIHQSGNTHQQLQNILQLNKEYKSINRDTLDHYTLVANGLSGYAANDREKLLLKTLTAKYYLRWGWTDSCIFNLDQALQSPAITTPAMHDIYADATYLKGLAYGMSARYKEALDIFYPLLSLAEKQKDTATMVQTLVTISSIDLQRNKPQTAITIGQQILALTQGNNSQQRNMAAAYVNMSDAYSLMGKSDSAIAYLNKGIPVFYRLQILNDLSTVLQKKAGILLRLHRHEEAEEVLKETAAIRHKIKDESTQVDEQIALASLYLEMGLYDKAIEICQRGLLRGSLTGGDSSVALTNKVNLRVDYYKVLAEAYKLKGDNNAYMATLEELSLAKDSFYQSNSAAAMAEVETRYEVQKKEATIARQQLDIVNKNFTLYITLSLTIAVAIIAWLLFYNYQKKQRLKEQLIRNEEQHKAELAVKDASETERKRIAADLHDSLGSYAASIKANADDLILDSNQQQHHIQLLQTNAQQMVSLLGDTIWALRKESLYLSDMSDRIKVFLQRLRPNFPAIKMQVEEQIDEDIALQPAKAFHLFMIVQEAINNALKHAVANYITIHITSSNSWQITIMDDGRGMTIDSQKKLQEGGNGLHNMRLRAEAIQCQIKWHNNHPSGTIVSIKELPLNT